MQGAVVQTPLQLSLPLSRQTGVHVYLKCEHLQNTGSFKLRGALNKLVKLTESPRRSNQIVAASSGNHGLAVALSARLLGFDAEVFVPASASPMKIDAIQGLGAKVTKIEGEPLLAETEARKKAELENLPLISPYNDLDVIAGQGTIGIELMEQLAELDAVVIAVGGGGLISGIGTFLKEQNPSIEIIGAWPKVARSLHACLEAGEIISIGEELTLSDGTAGGVEEGAVTFPIAQRVIDKTVLVSESEIACAMKDIGMHERWIIEGAAGVAVAGLGQLASEYQNKNVAVVLCGRNITLEKYLKAINEYVDLD
ncbi:MAG: threonine/serine dehydratase [Pseudomonadota bacterium]